MAVSDIVVDGNHVITDEQILERVGPLLRGRSIVRPPFDATREELDAMPYVESVEFERDLPNTVIIHLHEYRPLACLKAADGKNFFLAFDGRVLAEPAGASLDMPVLVTKEPCKADIGQMAECPDVQAGLDFLANIPVSFNYEFAEVSVSDGDIRARTKSGVNLHFGMLDDYNLKFEVLRQLLTRSAVAGAQVNIDVSVPERPVTNEEKPPQTAPETVVTESVPETGGAGIMPQPDAGQQTGPQ
jgi:hypothetical protein